MKKASIEERKKKVTSLGRTAILRQIIIISLLITPVIILLIIDFSITSLAIFILMIIVAKQFGVLAQVREKMDLVKFIK